MDSFSPPGHGRSPRKETTLPGVCSEFHDQSFDVPQAIQCGDRAPRPGNGLQEGFAKENCTHVQSPRRQHSHPVRLQNQVRWGTLKGPWFHLWQPGSLQTVWAQVPPSSRMPFYFSTTFIVCFLQLGLRKKKEGSRKQRREKKNRAKKYRGAKKATGAVAAKKK